MVLRGRIIKVKSWEEFKNLILKHHPKSIAYNIEQGIPLNNLTGLRLILPVKGVQYVFIDNVAGNYLRRTYIPLRKDKFGNLYIKDGDVIKFVKTQLKREDIKLHSYWTI